MIRSPRTGRRIIQRTFHCHAVHTESQRLTMEQVFFSATTDGKCRCHDKWHEPSNKNIQNEVIERWLLNL